MTRLPVLIWRALAKVGLVPAGLVPVGAWRGSWVGSTTVREPFTGAWQRNAELTPESVLMNPTVFSCVTLAANDVAKLRVRLMEQDDLGVWTETSSPAYSPVLRAPNHYQTPQQFWSSWMLSKLLTGNTYVLKIRDNRGVVIALYVLDPRRVVPLVATNGDIYYELRRDDLASVETDTTVTVPASEIIHDLMNPLFHPLVGVSPIFAAGMAALGSQRAAEFLGLLLANAARPGGILTAPGAVSDADVERIKERAIAGTSGSNVGKLLVLGDGLKYESMTMSPVDAQLIDQLKWGAETIAAVYHIPAYLVIPGSETPPYTSPESLFQQYYSQCIQTLLTAAEQSLDKGLELKASYGTEFDIDDLVWMDVANKTKAAADGIGSGALSPNEARRKYFGLGPVPGGDLPYLQQQYYSLEALAERDQEKPFSKPVPAPAFVKDASDEATFLAELTRRFAGVVDGIADSVG